MGILDDLLGLSGPNKPIMPGLLDAAGYTDPAQYDQARRSSSWGDFFAGLARGGAPSTSPRNFGSALTSGLEGFQSGGEAFDQSQLRAAQAAQARANVIKSAAETGNYKAAQKIVEDFIARRKREGTGEGSGSTTAPGTAPATAGESGSAGGIDFGGDVNAAKELVGKYEADGLAKRLGISPYVIGTGGADLSAAPLDENGFPKWGGYGNSHAAGRYQFQPGTWATYAKKAGVTDFSPESQDKVFAAAYADGGFRHWEPYNSALSAAIKAGGAARPAAAAGATPAPAPAATTAGVETSGPPPIPDLPGAPAGAAMPPPDPGLITRASSLTPTPVVPPGTPFDAESSPENRLTVGRLPPAMRPEPARQAQTALVNAYADALQKGFKGTMQDFAAQAERGGAGAGGPPIAPTTAGTDTITVPPPAPLPGVFGTVGGGDPDLGATVMPGAVSGGSPPPAPAPGVFTPAMAANPNIASPTPPAPPPPIPAGPLPPRPAGPVQIPALPTPAPGMTTGGLSRQQLQESRDMQDLSLAFGLMKIPIPDFVQKKAELEAAGQLAAAQKAATQPFDFQMKLFEDALTQRRDEWNKLTDQQKDQVAAANGMLKDQYKASLDIMAEKLKQLTAAGLAEQVAEATGRGKGRTELVDVERMGADGRPYTEKMPITDYIDERRKTGVGPAVSPTADPATAAAGAIITGAPVGGLVGKPYFSQEDLKWQEMDQKTFTAKQAGAEAAQLSIQRANDIRALIEKGAMAGPGVDIRLGLLRLGKALNLTGKTDNDTIANTEVYISQTAKGLKEGLAGLGPPVSNVDTQIAETIAGGKNLTTQGMLQLMEIQERYSRQNILNFNRMNASAPKGRFDRTVLEPPTYGARTAIGPNGERLWDNNGRLVPY